MIKLKSIIKEYVNTDVFEYQNKYAEPLISGTLWKEQWWRWHFEAAGDIIRELGKYSDGWADNGYIFEKINRLERFIKQQKNKNDIHYDDSYEKILNTEDKKSLENLKKAYEKQPVYTEPQIVAKEIVLNLIDNKLDEVQKGITYFKKFKNDRNALAQINSQEA